MKRMFLSFVLFLALTMAVPAETQAGDAFTKLGRGITNILTGWGELFLQTEIAWREKGPFEGTAIGLIQGICWTVVRTLAGVYEVATFPFGDYDQTVIEPEYVFSALGKMEDP